MGQPIVERPMPFLAGAIFALAMLGVGAPSTAFAACNRDSHSSAEREILASLSRIDGLSDEAGSRGLPDDEPARRPCSGPSCSGGSPRPMPSHVISPRIVERWCSAPGLVEISAPEGCRFWAEESAPLAVNRPCRLERPPRIPPV